MAAPSEKILPHHRFHGLRGLRLRAIVKTPRIKMPKFLRRQPPLETVHMLIAPRIAPSRFGARSGLFLESRHGPGISKAHA